MPRRECLVFAISRTESGQRTKPRRAPAEARDKSHGELNLRRSRHPGKPCRLQRFAKVCGSGYRYQVCRLHCLGVCAQVTPLGPVQRSRGAETSAARRHAARPPRIVPSGSLLADCNWCRLQHPGKAVFRCAGELATNGLGYWLWRLRWPAAIRRSRST